MKFQFVVSMALVTAFSPAQGERFVPLESLKRECIELAEVKVSPGSDDAAECRVSEFGSFGELERETYYYALYCLIPIYEKNKAQCSDSSFPAQYYAHRASAIFVQNGISSQARMLFERANEEIGTYFYDKPQLIPSQQGMLLLIPIRVDGTGAGNVSELYIRENGHWISIDTESWRKDLDSKIPKGLQIWKGIWPDYRTMTAEAGLYKEGDTNCCPTGGKVLIRLDLVQHSILLKDVHTSLQ
jgi:hypothetical protein